MKESTKRAQSIVGTSPGRPKDDFYPTPPEATEALLRVWRPRGRAVWEPACGDGAISKVLKDNGFLVMSSDLYDHGYGTHAGVDFLSVSSIETWYETIITNPPYKLAQEFVEHALEIGCKEIAMLLKLSFLEGQRRKRFFETTPLKHVFVFSNRLTMTRNGEPSRNGGMIAFAWYVWDVGYEESPKISWISTKEVTRW